ncbi:hypothetical protein EK21DRAFT_116461 [Setomelanomma holmii]|uniref:DUF7730 domain-containing protein n=1 Tax=Setomelanomma holmii TaxID=210430 RepID=A0A9P4H2B7_9PLEO|nr:hypothetical protein EK21DRAFT_116461 [Setomelanomma holmii]
MVITRRMAAAIFTQCAEGMLDPTPQGSPIQIMERNSAASPFFQLPPEIRNRIYTHVLGGYLASINKEPRDRNAKLKSNCYSQTGPLLPPGLRQPAQEIRYATDALQLLFFCRQVYSEARLLPFTLNTFECSGYEGIQAWRKAYQRS